MRRKDGPFDKPPSYYHNNKKRSQDADRRTGFEENDLPENVIPININDAEKLPKRVSAKRGRAERVVLTISLLLFTLAVGGSLIRYMAVSQTPIAVVNYGSIGVPRVARGVIVRNETVHVAPVSGSVTFNVADGVRVRLGTVVLNIENASGIIPLVAQSEELSRRIIDMQNLRGDMSAVSYEVDILNDAIRRDLDSRLLRLNSASREPLYALRDSLNQNMELRNDMLLNENAGAVRMLVSEHRHYAAMINENRTAISATSGGILSHTVDGFEDVFSPSNLNYITREQTRMHVGPDYFVQNRVVDAGDAVFKIIESNVWYIASYIENDLILDWSPGRAVRLYIEKDGAFIGHPFWVNTIRRGDSESFVTLRTDLQVQDFLGMRTVSFKTYDGVYSGLRIPESAITERTFLKIPREYVSTVRHNINVVHRRVGSSIVEEPISMKPLRGIPHREGYVYIIQDFDNIRRGDTIVLGSDDESGYVIDELVSAQGVFRTNTGVAVFVSVNTEGMVRGDDGYVILDPANNIGGVIQHDRIIRDAGYRFIREGDIVNP